MLYGASLAISSQTDSSDSAPYKEKTTLPRASANVSEFVCVTALAPCGAIPVSRFGNINPTPFRPTVPLSYFRLTLVHPVSTAFAEALGPTDPCSTAVHMEPFSSLVLKGLT